MHIDDAVTLLEYHRATLEIIHLDRRQKVAFESGPKLGPVISFRAFPVLHHLFLHMDEIHDRLGERDFIDDSELWVQILPLNIRSLHLASTVLDKRFPREERLMQGLADAVSRGHCPSLREVRWGGRVNQGEHLLPAPSLCIPYFETNKGPHEESKESSYWLVGSPMFATTGVDFKDAVSPGTPAISSIASEIHTGYLNFVPQKEHSSAFPLPAEDEFPW